MIYILKSIASLLLPPGIIIIVLPCCAFSLYKQKAKHVWTLSALTLLIYSLSCSYVSDALLRTLEDRYVPSDVTTADVVIVLGGGATLDTPNVNGKGHLSGSAANRILTGVMLQRNLNIQIIVSVGQVFSDSGPEAEIMKRTVAGLGVPEQNIIAETESLNTRQNAENVRRILDERGYLAPILVTSAFHMPRAVKYFESQGIKTLTYPTDYRTNLKLIFAIHKFFPSASAFENSCITLREYLGLLGTVPLIGGNV
jgi:uncharacterized SAM-binding protein YcdF (DUF218 family)